MAYTKAGFPTRSDTNRVVQSQKMARGFIIRVKKVKGLYSLYSKIKVLITCEVTVQLICAFVFAYAKDRYSHNVAQIEYCMHAHVLIVEFNKLAAEKL